MKSSAGHEMPFGLAMLAGMLALTPAPGHAYQELQTMHQAEQRSGGRITVEESNIHVIRCNGAGENGGQFYIYQYLKRSGFRAILPPNWGRPIGGHDWGSFAEAAAAACGGGRRR